MSRESAIAATSTRDGDVSTLGVHDRYLHTLAEFAEAAIDHRLTAPLLTTIYRLNAAYYLQGYLPPEEHAAAVDQAIDAVANARRRLHLRTSGSWTRFAAMLRRSDEATGVQRLLTATERRNGDLHTLLVAQHVLEVLPDVPAPLRSGLLASVERYVDIPAGTAASRGGRDGRDRQGVHARDEQQLRCWARQNARPPRERELVAWAGCISRREPRQVLTQALASGLCFGSLVDALTVSTAMQALQLPGRESGFLIAAAHAVRRLTDLGDRPAVGAWLDLAGRISGRVELSDARVHASGRDSRELALTAVRSGDPRLIQAAEAALVESESLPAELSPLTVDALSRLLTVNTTDD